MVKYDQQRAHLIEGPSSILAGLQQRCRRLRGEGLLRLLCRLSGRGDLLRRRGNVAVPQTNPKSVRQNPILPELQEIVRLTSQLVEKLVLDDDESIYSR